ncbi:MAG: beta-hydroxyacyl-ACP dehydratase [Coriobacteriia bacterium]|nr:beta-hydroxyacyl-ACP dehydratase [Coriobacteriia bacterium]MBS5477135.1 beta-hydroxyacyl-ACP dehydratase [Coriobacteriia bacterium]
MDREQLKTILPHREPMLLLDEASVVDGQAHGTYHVRGDEFFLQGHFPGNPVVPGVIQCEMIAQNCCVLLADDPALKGATPYYTSLDKVRFKHPVAPGDTIELVCSITKAKGPFRFATGTASVNGTLCTTAEFSFALVQPKAPEAE